MPVRANHTASSRKSCSRRAESVRTLERYYGFAKLTVQSRIQFFADVLDCLSRWQLLPLCKVNQTNYTITLPNGSQFLFKGMQDPERIKSIKGLSDVVMEEASEFTLDDYTQLTLRLTPNTTRHVLPYITVRTRTTASLTQTTSRRLKRSRKTTLRITRFTRSANFQRLTSWSFQHMRSADCMLTHWPRYHPFSVLTSAMSTTLVCSFMSRRISRARSSTC